MANVATIIKTEVEPYVRVWLKSEFGQTFRETKLEIVTGVGHKVDAVSEDGTIAADILSNRAVTRGGKHNTGGARKAENDFWKLANLTDTAVVTRMLIFTDDGFRAVFEKLIGNPNAVDISLRYCKLPSKIQRHLDEALDDASREQRSRNERRR